MKTYDVAIIGGGPAGSTVGSYLKKYKPELKVLIVEKEKFPRDHIGESQLPAVGRILFEMGAWDKVEAAQFPIKIGATYRWGESPDLWDFNFVPIEHFRTEARPAPYAGQRTQTALQVDRARYDKILLDHSQSLGCEVLEQTRVSEIHHSGDFIDSITLSSGETVAAKHYVDASGNAAIIRRKLGVGINVPTALKNIAFWDYWQNAEWADSVGVGGTRVQVLSIGTGWIWFIPLSPTRTSIGFVCPAEHYKQSGRTPEDLYNAALQRDDRIQGLIKNAIREDRFQATKDWSFLADRMTGENWFLVGESAGFADPILAAGMTLAHTGAREAAYTILSIENNEHKPIWLKEEYERLQKTRIGQHIRFADFWYSANGQFTDLQDYTAEIAKDAGLNLTPRDAFQWLGTGGFTNDNAGVVAIGTFDLAALKDISSKFLKEELDWELNKYNHFKLNLANARNIAAAIYRDGKVIKIRMLRRENRSLPLTGYTSLVIAAVKKHHRIEEILAELKKRLMALMAPEHAEAAMKRIFEALEALVVEGWVNGKLDKNEPRLRVGSSKETSLIRAHDGDVRTGKRA
jgi:flavin-dependent dehydrogenase